MFTVTSIMFPQSLKPILSPKERNIFTYILKVCNHIPFLSKNKYAVPVVRVAGGWIRDQLLIQIHPELGIKQPKDIDIAIDIMDGLEFGAFMQLYDRIEGVQRCSEGSERGTTANKVGVKFCTIDGEDIEFVQLRTDLYGQTRHDVSTRPGTPEEDAVRRDLTINALYYNLNTGQVEDFSGQGLSDLRSLILRTPQRPYPNYLANEYPDAPPGMNNEQWSDFEIHRVYNEDPIRVLRILRFFSRWKNSALDPKCIEGMKQPDIVAKLTQKLHNKTLSKEDPGVAPEIIWEELLKIMAGEQPEQAINIMHETGVMKNILGLPENFAYEQFEESQRNPHHELSFLEHTKEVMRQTVEACKRNDIAGWYRAMLVSAAWLHDIGKIEQTHQKWKTEPTENDTGHRMYPGHEKHSADIWLQFADNAKMSQRDKEFVHALISAHMEPHKLIDTTVKAIKTGPTNIAQFMYRNPQWKFILLLAEADSLSKSKVTDPEVGKLYERIRKDIIPKLPGLISNQTRDPLQTDYNKEWIDSDYLWPKLIKPGEIIQIIDPNNLLPVKPSAYLPIVQEALSNYQTGLQESKTIDQQRQDAIVIVQSLRPKILNMFVPKAFGGNPGQVIMSLPEYAAMGAGPHIGVITKRVQEALYSNPKLTLQQQIEIAKQMAQEIV